MSARRREVSSPPRRVRFESFYDGFNYAPGGQALAGCGPWSASPFTPARASLLVRAQAGGGGVVGGGVGGVVGVAGELRSNTLALGAGGGAAAPLALPWSFEFTVSFDGPTPAPGWDTYCQVLLGDENGMQNVLFVDIDSTYATTGKAMIYLTDDRGASFYALAPWALGGRYQVRMTWDGTRHRAFVNGTQVTSGHLRSPAEITLQDGSLYIVGDASGGGGGGWTIFDFAYRLG